jgi:hypothetical protein
MKLRKQAAAKALIVAATAGLLFAFYGIIRGEPRIKAEETPTATPPVDYSRFFTPGSPPPGAADQPVTIPNIRTRAS